MHDWDTLEDDPKDENIQSQIQLTKEVLTKAFKQIFDDRYTYVMTDREYEAYTKEDD